MRSKVLNILSLLFNSFIAVIAVAALTIIFVRENSLAFSFFDTYLCLIIILTCLTGMVYNIKTFSNGEIVARNFYLNFKLSVAGLALTNTVIGAGFIYDGIINISFFVPRLILPILLFISIVFIEVEAKYDFNGVLLSPIPLIVYLTVVLTLTGTGVVKPPFPYLDALNNPWLTSLLIFIVLVSGCIILTYGIRLLNKLMHYVIIEKHVNPKRVDNDWMPSQATSDPDEMKLLIKEAKKEERVEDIVIEQPLNEQEQETLQDIEKLYPSKQEEPVVHVTELKDDGSSEVVIENPDEETKAISSNDDKPSEELKDKPSDTKTISRVYHVSHHKFQAKWQVKLAGSTRAVKLFKTQKEAIDYAKSLVKTQGGYYLIHGVDGKIRKG